MPEYARVCQSTEGGYGEMITVLHRGGYAQMITILHRGGGSLGTPKSDYVICARPLKRISIEVWWEQTLTLQRMVAKTWQWIEFQEESENFFLPQ